MDVNKPLTPGACATMVQGWPKDFVGVVQVIEAAQLLQPDGQPYLFPRWSLVISDGQNSAKVLAGRTVCDLLLQGRLPMNAVVQIEAFQQMYAEGKGASVVIIDHLIVLRVSARIGAPKRLRLLFEEGQGALGNNTHLERGFPSQEVAPYPVGGAGAASALVSRRVVADQEEVDEEEDPIQPALLAGRPANERVRLPAGKTVRVALRDFGHILGVFYIIARITRITEPKLVNTSGIGKKMQCMLTMHDETAEIDAVAWDKWAEKAATLEVGKIYRIQNFEKNLANAQFSRANHIWQLKFVRDTKFTEVVDNGHVPEVYLDFKRINQLERMPENRRVDVTAIIVRLGQPMKGEAKRFPTTSKYKEPLETVDRIDVYLMDDSQQVMRLAAFDEYIDVFDTHEGEVVTIKSVLTSKFAGHTTLKTQRGSTQVLFDDKNRAHVRLRRWFESPRSLGATVRLITGAYGADSNPSPEMIAHANVVTIGEMRRLKPGTKDTPDMVKVRGTLLFSAAGKEYIYLACPDPTCNKKAQIAELDTGGSVWYCAHCKQVYLEPSFKFNVRLRDTTGAVHWITSFNGATRALLKADARTMYMLYRKEETIAQYYARLNSVQGKMYTVAIQASTVKEGEFKGLEDWIAVQYVEE